MDSCDVAIFSVPSRLHSSLAGQLSGSASVAVPGALPALGAVAVSVGLEPAVGARVAPGCGVGVGVGVGVGSAGPGAAAAVPVNVVLWVPSPSRR